MRPLTAIITCHNEEDNILAVLDSLSFCNEIIVVDSFSTDGTPELVRQTPARLLQREYKSPADQKNWAIPQATHEWILLLDADERVTNALREEIRGLLSADNIPNHAYWVRRDNHFLGKRIRYSGWQRDKVIRFFHRDHNRYADRMVHEEIEPQGRVGMLRGRLDHHTYKDMDHYLAKVRRYARWSAMDKRMDRPPGFYHFVIKPWFRFCKHYFLDLGFLDGMPGYIISRTNAYGIFLRYWYMMDQQRKDVNGR